MKKTGNIDIKLGKAIGFYRTAAGLSRKDLALRLGITHQQLQKYERGINRISVARLLDIASVMKIDVIKFLELESYEVSEDEKYMRSILEITKHLSRIKDVSKLDAIKNLVKSISASDSV